MISVIIPCRNECEYIKNVITKIYNQLKGIDFEIIVSDGMSNDGTREIITNLCSELDNVYMIDNPEMIVSTAMNRAISAAKGDIIIRIDAHTDYSHDYIQACLDVINSKMVDNVGGPWRAKASTYVQNAISLAFQSPLSSGGASSHNVDYEGPVDSVYLGCWRREVFNKYGTFDEDLVRNQDDEFNFRIIQGGGTVWQSPDIKSWYTPRSSILSLFKQYVQYGFWKVRVIQKHGMPASWRHLVPAIFVGMLISFAVLLPVASAAKVGLLSMLALYVAATVFSALYVCIKARKLLYFPLMPIAYAAFHFGYGIGFLRGLFEFYILKRKHNSRYSKLTR